MTTPTTRTEPLALNIIRKWPEGFQSRLQHVWLDVVSFIPDVKLYDLQRVLAEFGFRMEVYEEAAAPPAPVQQPYSPDQMPALAEQLAVIRARQDQQIAIDSGRAAPVQQGELVITKNDAGHIVSVTRQNEDGVILSVLALSAPIYKAAPVQQGEAEPADKLKPCPFCGAAAHFEIDDARWEWVECESCGMQGNRGASLMEDCKPMLAEAWNRRATPPQAQPVPIFWYRPVGEDGLYEGPVHNNSVGGRMLREEKPGEWVPLFAGKAPEVQAQPSAQEQPSQAAKDVLAERQRQISGEGWTPGHDDEHDEGQLSAAACAYALAASDFLNPLSQGDGNFTSDEPPPAWPADWYFKPAEPRRMLVKAAALILAEIERLDRAANTKGAGS